MFRKLNRPRMARRISEKSLLCAFLFALLAGGAAPRLAAGMDAAGEAARIAGALHAEFVKGFRVLDDDGDGAVDFTALVRALRGVGYGKAAAAQRGRGGGNPDLIFEEFDVNEDGVLSGDEPGPFLRESEYFADGEVTLEEYRIAARELARRRGNRGEGRGGGRRRGGGGKAVRTSDLEFMAAIDANDDGALTTAEAWEAIEREIRENLDSRASLDGDGDGAVSPREYGLSQPIRGETDADGLDGHARGHFRREDFDGDGSLSVAEIGERTRASLSGRYRAMQLALRLQALDANEDGSLQDSELGGLAESGALRMGAGAGAGGGALEVGRLYGMLYRLPPERTAEIERLIGE